jgi:hypothetical protein
MIALLTGFPLKAAGFLATAATAAGPLVWILRNADTGGRGGNPAKARGWTDCAWFCHPPTACGLGRLEGKLQARKLAEAENSRPDP